MLVKFKHWLESAAPGDRFEYHRGPDLAKSEDGLARLAMEASLDRKVLLMLRKYKTEDFGFFAIRVSNSCPEKMFPHNDVKSLGPGRVQARPARST